MGFVERVRVVVVIEFVLLPVLMAALVSCIALDLLHPDVLLSMFLYVTESEREAWLGVRLALVLTVSGSTLFFHAVALFLLKSGLADNNDCRLRGWVVLESVLAAVGLLLLIVSGRLLRPVWWWWLLNVVSYIYRTYSIHTIRLYARRVKNLRLRNLKAQILF